MIFNGIHCSGKKGVKKEEQYRTMWAELERLLTAHSDQSLKHHALLECLMEVRQVTGLETPESRIRSDQ